MIYDVFYHDLIQPMAIIQIFDRYNQEVYRGKACFITDNAWKRIKDCKLTFAGVDLDSKKIIVMVDIDFYEGKVHKPFTEDDDD